MPTCRHCGPLPASCFYWNARDRRYDGVCRACRSLARRKRYQARVGRAVRRYVIVHPRTIKVRPPGKPAEWLF